MELLRENPILRHELAQVFCRRGAFLRLIAFAAIVALAIFAIWPREAKFLNMRDRVSRDVFANLAAALQILVLFFTPAYAATSVTRDREQGFLETLLSGNFTPSAIFRGKWIAATAFIWLTVAATMPIAANVFQLGGISPGEFVAVYLELFLWSLVICGYGVRCSLMALRSAEALAQVYLRVLPFGVFWVLVPQLHPLWILLPMALLPRLTRLGLAEYSLKYPFDYPARTEGPSQPESDLGIPLLLSTRETPMRDWENPVIVRELNYESLHSAGQILRTLPYLALGGITSAILLIALFRQPHAFHLSVLALSVFLVPAIGASAFTSESNQGTLESLVISLLRRSSIVAGKIWISIRMSLILMLIFEAAALPLLLVCCPNEAPLWPQAVLVLASALILSATLSVLWSKYTASMPQAITGAYATVFALIAGIPALCRHLFIYNDLAMQNYSWLGVASPAMPFLVLMLKAPWVRQIVSLHGTPVMAWDSYSTNFALFAIAGSVLAFLIIVAGLDHSLRRFWKKLLNIEKS